ncbi:asparagine synthase-related protein [Sphingobium sp. TB-6]|uniref:asparagine synthase-related protein n=1 Tax=Sphingobium sp. TB-6 TaxID=2728850 RepID=UPI001F0E1DD3|nr:asparagine synthase-related protein [Sphingobium sp. TB-6]
MAARYLIASTDCSDRRRAIAASVGRRGLKLAWQSDQLMLFLSNDTPVQIVEGVNFIGIGRIFSQMDFRPMDLAKWTDGNERTSPLSDLLEQGWGQYVAVKHGREGAQILRDPSGGLPCYHVSGDGCHAAASDVGLLVVAGLLRPAVNYDYILHQFRYPNQRSPSTALVGAREVLPGFVLDWQGAMATETSLWSPWKHAARRFEGGLDQAALRLRDITDKCIKALGRSTASPILIGVSGGLDSSIIAAALREVEFGAHGISIATSHPDGDERSYARGVCVRLGLPFDSALYAARHVDPARPSAPHQARPTGEPFLQSYDHVIRELARAVGSKTLFRGNGGDAVFCFMQNVTPILDRWETRGARGGLLQTLADVCRMTDSSIPQVLSALRRRRDSSPVAFAMKIEDRFLVARDATREMFDAHPWFDAPAGLARGRIIHGLWATRVQRFTEGYARDDELELVCPLLSQPIVEFCLSIPSWLWISGGINRAVARQAYRRILGDDNMRRVRKGGPSAFCVELLDTYRSQYREMLLDGLLAQHHVIDREAVSAYLAYEGPQRDDDYLRLLALVDAEAWARHWAGAATSPIARESTVDCATSPGSHLTASEEG